MAPAFRVLDLPSGPAKWPCQVGPAKWICEVPRTNLYVRETTDTSHRQANARVSDPSMAPHLNNMPGEPNLGQAVQPPGESIFVPMQMPSYVRETYHNMQATMRRRHTIEAHRSRDRRAMQAAISALEQRGDAPTPADSDLTRNLAELYLNRGRSLPLSWTGRRYFSVRHDSILRYLQQRSTTAWNIRALYASSTSSQGTWS